MKTRLLGVVLAVFALAIVPVMPAAAISENSSVSVVVNNSAVSGQVELEVLSTDDSQLNSNGMIRVTLRYKNTDTISIAVNGTVARIYAVTSDPNWQTVTFDIYLPLGAGQSTIDISADDSGTLTGVTVQLIVTQSPPTPPTPPTPSQPPVSPRPTAPSQSPITPRNVTVRPSVYPVSGGAEVTEVESPSTTELPKEDSDANDGKYTDSDGTLRPLADTAELKHGTGQVTFWPIVASLAVITLVAVVATGGGNRR